MTETWVASTEEYPANELEEGITSLSSKEPKNRLKAINRLAAISSGLRAQDRDRVVAAFEKLLEDKQPPFIRWNLAFALGKVAHPSVITVLEKLLDDEHANVRFRVALSLGLIGDEQGIKSLGRLATDSYKIGEHSVVRAYAALAMGRLPHEESVEILGRLVEDDDPVVRWHATVALGDVALESGIPHLAKVVEDKIAFVRAHAAIALAQISHPNGLPYLERLAKDSNPRVASIAGSALELLRETTISRMK